MPIKNCPFSLYYGAHRPVLPISIINPDTNLSHKTYGIIDTGADECAIPAYIAKVLGHNLQAGKTKKVGTGNGETTAYAHATEFALFHPATGELLYKVKNTPIDFMPNLHVVLLGVNSFLSKFILNINYPGKFFSITHPSD